MLTLIIVLRIRQPRGFRAQAKAQITNNKNNTFLLTLLLFVLPLDWFEMEVNCIRNVALGWFHVSIRWHKSVVRYSTTRWMHEQQSINWFSIFFFYSSFFSSCFFFFTFFSLFSVFNYNFCSLAVRRTPVPSPSPLPLSRLVNIYFLDQKLLSVFVGCFCWAKFITRTNVSGEKKMAKQNSCLLRGKNHTVRCSAECGADFFFSPSRFHLLF